MARRSLVLLLAAGLALAFTAARAEDKKGSDIDGDYAVVAAVQVGKEVPAEGLKTFQGISIKDGTLTLKMKEDNTEFSIAAKIKIDPSKKPAEMDLTPQEGPNKGKTVLGIYALDKDELKMAWAFDEKAPRPKDFTSTAENKTFTLTLKKKK